MVAFGALICGLLGMRVVANPKMFDKSTSPDRSFEVGICNNLITEGKLKLKVDDNIIEGAPFIEEGPVRLRPDFPLFRNDLWLGAERWEAMM
jgi:hypothetical protein